MKYEKYISLIKSLEVSAAHNKRAYELKVLLLILLGYGYFAGLIVLVVLPILVVPLALFVIPGEVVRLILILGKLWFAVIPALGLYFGFLGSAIKSIFAKVPDPEGTELKRTDAPELFAFVDKACGELKARRPQRILINDQMNAAIVTMPRFGIFGRKVLLIIGVPLLRALSPDQLKAVLAHEIGHISGKHGAFAKWAYQMREAWSRLIESQEENDGKFNALYKGFIDWFFPLFNAYSFVLMREHERDADRDACLLAGAQNLGEALVQIEVKHQSVNKQFWKQIHKENLSDELPPTGVFSRMLGSLAFTGETAAADLRAAVTEPTDFDDSHPSLGERLRTIGYWRETEEIPDLPGAVDRDAAQAFLGPSLGLIVDAYNSTWDAEVARNWKERYNHYREAGKRISELEQKHRGEELDLEELRELTQLIADRDGLEFTEPYVKEAAERFPENGTVWYNLGLARLANDDDRGLADLDKAASLDKDLKFDADQLAFSYLRRKGRFEEGVEYANAIDDQVDAYQKANEERQRAEPIDQYEPHNLPVEFIEIIPKRLSGLEEISAIYVAHKKVQHFPESPFRVLFVDVRPKVKGDADPASIFEIVSRQLDTGEIHFFALLNNQWGNMRDRLEAIPGARIYVGKSVTTGGS